MKIQLKNKFINHLLKNGNKKTCEKNLFKSFKILQKSSKKSFKRVVQQSIINSSPIFRIIVLKKKKKKKKKFTKEVPAFVTQSFERISWGIKYILNFKKKKNLTLKDKLKQDILLNSKNKGDAVNIKSNFLKKALEKKRFLSHFRW